MRFLIDADLPRATGELLAAVLAAKKQRLFLRMAEYVEDSW